MKIVIAYIKPEMLSDVVYALHGLEGLRGASICDGRGFGAWRLDESPEAVQREPGNFRPHARIEIACSDNMTAEVMKTICESARTGMPGDGLVFSIDADTCVRICTGEPDAEIR
ncbi:P-II family nitrogen regulator [bacterium]|nr:P-II family nitrogen regulator [bacterium]